MTYKAIITDFDGTLARKDKGVCEYNIKAIGEATEKGFKFALCTGRTTASIMKMLKPLPFKPLVGSFNGGEITNSLTGEKIYSNALTADECLPLIDYCLNRGLNCQIYDDENAYCVRATRLTEFYEKTCACPDYAVDDIKSEISRLGKTPKFMIIDEPETVDARLPEILKEFGGKYEVARSFSGLVDFTPKGNNKGLVVTELCRIWGIDESDCIAIGDEFNDIPMLKKAGLGAAVATAQDGVKAAADYVTERDNDDGAVGEVIRRFLLCE